MTEVRVAAAPYNDLRKYVGKVGTVIGMSGQFVKVKFPGSENHWHLFLPGELKEF